MTQSEIQYYVQKRREGWDNSQVREEMKSNGYSKKDIYYYVNEIDDVFVRGIKNKSELSLNNFSLRVLETLVGIFLLIFGLYLLIICVVNGPAILNLIVGFSASSGGYYFIQKGKKGFKDIRKAAKERPIAVNNKDVLDD